MQQGHATEGPRAGAALVLLHFRVGLQVGTQVGSISKSPVAVLTSEGALTCVCADVSSEQPWSGEGLAAGGAHTGQSV